MLKNLLNASSNFLISIADALNQDTDFYFIKPMTQTVEMKGQ